MVNTTLDGVKKGTCITIANLPDGMLRFHLIRIGISEGDTVYCLERLPGGTIVIQKNRQEIAIGYDLARQIAISNN